MAVIADGVGDRGYGSSGHQAERHHSGLDRQPLPVHLHALAPAAHAEELRIPGLAAIEQGHGLARVLGLERGGEFDLARLLAADPHPKDAAKARGVTAEVEFDRSSLPCKGHRPNHLNEAIAQFQEALRLQGDSAAAHANLADALSNTTDRLGDAVAQYEIALELDPGNAQVHSNLGLVLNAQGRPEEAIAHYKEALRIMPGFVEIRLNIALALLNMPGRRNEAAEQLEAYLQVRPANEMTQQILAQIQGAPPR